MNCINVLLFLALANFGFSKAGFSCARFLETKESAFKKMLDPYNKMSRPYIVLNAACPTAGMNMCYGIACFSLADGKQNLFMLDCMHAKDMKSFCKKREDELKKVPSLSNLKCVCRFGNEGEQNANANFDQEFNKITIVPATQNSKKTTIVPPATQNFKKTTIVPATQVPNTELPFNPFVQYDCADYNTCAGTVNSVSIFVICAIVILIII